MNHSDNRISLETVVTPGLILFLGVAFSLWFMWTPPMDDDLHYLLYFRDYLLHGGDYPIGNVWEMIRSEWHINNIRWVNMITAVTLVLIPRWVMAIILGACLSLSLWWSITLAGAKRKLASSIAVVTLIVCALPWHANVAIMDYAHNYIFASAIFTGFFILWFKDAPVRDFWHAVGLITVGVFAGESHEGFSLPVLCAIIVFALFNRMAITRRRLLLTAALAIGVAILLTAEGKASRSGIVLNRPLTQWIYTLIFYSPLTTVMLGIFFTCWIKTGKNFVKQFAKSPAFLFLLVSLASFFMSGLLFINCRASWAGELAAAINIPLLCDTYLRRAQSPSVKRAKYGLATVATIFLIIHMLTVDIYARRCYNDYRHIISSYLRDPDNTIYYDYTTSSDVPLIALGKVASSYPWIGDYPLGLFRDFYHPGSKTPMVVPSQLKGFSIDKADKIPGDNPMYLYKGHFIAPHGTVSDGARYLFHPRCGFRRASAVVTIPFANQRGDSLDLCAAWQIDQLPRFIPIVKIDRE